MDTTKRTRGKNKKTPAPLIRCAIYTRKSTTEGLASDFNTLHAQHEAALAYIQSQKHEGWKALPKKYDDGGFSGGNLDRPALQQLLLDVKNGKIDCVVIYKLDRISRSLMDFARIIELLEQHNVSLVSITQAFNTKDSMGRLTLNILLAFAQFEREIIAERTRDKMCAARRKGKWAGGHPVLGYDVAAEGGKLLVNKVEKKRVQEIFKLYLQYKSLTRLAQELSTRGWQTKSWVKKDGKIKLGKPFIKTNLQSLLNNIIYLGKVNHKGEIYEGEHEAIIDKPLWTQVHELLKWNSKFKGNLQKNKHGALLKGLVRCAHCNTAMFHAYTQRRNKQYRYYVCSSAQKKGYKTCLSKSVSAVEMERFVVERIREISKKTLKHRKESEISRKLLSNSDICKEDLQNALSMFDIWEMLFPKEQARILQTIIAKIVYDGAVGKLVITFRPAGIQALSAELKTAREERKN